MPTNAPSSAQLTLLRASWVQNARHLRSINTTVELQRMTDLLTAENVSLEDIRRELEKGLKRTKTQLDNMQSSVNYLIDQREKAIIETGENLKIEKANTYGKY